MIRVDRKGAQSLRLRVFASRRPTQKVLVISKT